MKVVLIFDQGLAGAGGKSNPNIGLELAKGGIGSALMLEPYFQKIDAKVFATLYCGNEYFLNNQDEVVNKMTAMVKKINPDIVVCGPCFNFIDYAKMCAMITESINNNTDIPSITMMSDDNAETISNYKDKISIIKMPKKGGVGLSDSLEDLANWMKKKYEKSDSLTELEKKICY